MFAILAAFLAQSSLLVRPLELRAAPPETRALAAVNFNDEHNNSDPFVVEEWRSKARAGSEFAEFAKMRVQRPLTGASAIYGTYWRGMLSGESGGFLFDAEVGEVDTVSGLTGLDSGLVVQRLERDAACRQIFVENTDAAARARAEEIMRELRAGADFAKVARERSDDRASSLRGGDLAIFERSKDDALLREAAFRCGVGEIVGPIESPLGFHVLQRVGVEALDPRLRDDSWARARGILLAFTGAEGSHPSLAREQVEANRLADELAVRIRRGEDMATLAREFDDDRGGRERGGDLGWVRRKTTAMPAFFDKLFTEPPGSLIGPIASTAGFILLRREDSGPRSRIHLYKREFLDLAQWVRALSESDAPLPELAGISEAVAAARALRATFSSPMEWGRIEGELQTCWNASDFAARAGASDAARTYASALAALEPNFHSEVWPSHERTIDTALAELRPALVELGDVAVEFLLRDLGVSDPRVAVPVFLVAEAPTPGGSTLRVASGAFIVLDADRFAGSTRLEAVLHEASHALDVASAGTPSVLSELRERLRAAGAERALRDVPHTLQFLASAGVVREVFDPRHVDYGESCGYYAKVPAALEATRGPWEQVARGSLDRKRAVALIAERAARH